MADKAVAARAPSGTHDVLWPESTRWEALLAGFAAQVERAGYGLAHTPIFEDVRVFRRGIGEGSDVVGKEMYEFEDRGGRLLALRPEGTAPMVRAFVQHRPPLPWKAWYATPAFRYERPQAGRYRQHHQLGVEALGPSDPDLDVEVVGPGRRLLPVARADRLHLRLNSMGDDDLPSGATSTLLPRLPGRAPRPALRRAPDRLEANPLRVLDCKRDECRAATDDAPRLVDHLCDPCRGPLRPGPRRPGRPRGALRARPPAGPGVRLLHPHHVRVRLEALESAQNGIGGGGRYDGLVEMLGGPPTPGIGFGIGIERLLLACDAEGVFAVDPAPLDAFVVDITGGTAARDLTAALRRAGLRADRAFDDRSMKAQLKAADRSGAWWR